MLDDKGLCHRTPCYMIRYYGIGLNVIGEAKKDGQKSWGAWSEIKAAPDVVFSFNFRHRQSYGVRRHVGRNKLGSAVFRKERPLQQEFESRAWMLWLRPVPSSRCPCIGLISRSERETALPFRKPECDSHRCRHVDDLQNLDVGNTALCYRDQSSAEFKF